MSGAHPLGDLPPGCGDSERRSSPCQSRDEPAGFENLPNQFRTQVSLSGHNRTGLDDQVGVPGRATNNDQVGRERHVGRVGIRHRELVDDRLAVHSSVLGSLSVLSLFRWNDVFDGDCHN